MHGKSVKAAFCIFALLIVIMAGATVLEKCCGSDAVFRYVYHSPVFIGLWAVLSILGILIFMNREHLLHKTTTALIHLAFCVILCGAFISHTTGQDGALHLREGESAAMFITRDGEHVELPFSVTLEQFGISYYKGTSTPEDYRSKIKISSPDNAGSQSFEVSMNKICKYDGYRFYQTSYDEDEGGSTLSVNHDPYGVPVSYSGYILLMLAMVLFFFQKNTLFRKALRNILSGEMSVASQTVLKIFISVFLIIPAFQQEAVAARQTPKYLPEEVAASFGNMYVYYNGRVVPMSTLTRDVTMKLYGKPSYRGLNADQVMTGWIFYPQDWRSKTMDDIKPARRDLANVLSSGTLLKIFPERDSLADSQQVEWYAAVDDLPFNIPTDRWFFIRKVMSLAGESVTFGKWEDVNNIFVKIRAYQVKYAGADMLPSDTRFKAEQLYDRIGLPRIPAMAALTVGLILFVLSAVGYNRRWLHLSAASSALCLFAYLTVVLGLRWFVSGYVPMSNGFEVMMFMGWILMLLTLSGAWKFPLVLPFGFITCGFALLVSSMGESDPQITSLMPVLSSPLLSIHVASMMISYSLLGMLMMNSIMAIVRGARHAGLEYLNHMRDYGLLILYPAVFLLACGTFLGAVWANVSWGSYWAWDPKEVWALITLMVYAFPMHSSVLKPFRNPRVFHWYCIAAFLCVIITYFGVNFILGGMHSYA